MERSAPSLASVIVASREQVHCDLDHEAVILSLPSSTYYGLNHVATRIWSLVQEPIEVTRLRDKLLTEYDVDGETLEADLLGLLSQLADRKLIEVHDPAAE